MPVVFTNQRNPGMHASLDRLFAGGNLMVELGCGGGADLDLVAPRYARAIGFDLERPPASSNGRRWHFTQADLNRGVPLPDDQADLVYANQVIEHIANPLAFVMEARRILRPGGSLVVTTPNVRYVRHLWTLVVRGSMPLTSARAQRTPTEWDEGHIHFLTPNDLLWLAREAGFREARTRAVILPDGALQPLRRLFERWADSDLVKQCLSGNALLVAVK